LELFRILSSFWGLILSLFKILESAIFIFLIVLLLISTPLRWTDPNGHLLIVWYKCRLERQSCLNHPPIGKTSATQILSS
jgi:hypothetical protein